MSRAEKPPQANLCREHRGEKRVVAGEVDKWQKNNLGKLTTTKKTTHPKISANFSWNVGQAAGFHLFCLTKEMGTRIPISHSFTIEFGNELVSFSPPWAELLYLFGRLSVLRFHYYKDTDSRDTRHALGHNIAPTPTTATTPRLRPQRAAASSRRMAGHRATQRQYPMVLNVQNAPMGPIIRLAILARFTGDNLMLSESLAKPSSVFKMSLLVYLCYPF